MSRLGEAYRDYAARVPRWLPSFNRGARRDRREKISLRILRVSAVEGFSWRDTLFSERGTFVAMAAGYVLLWIKARF